MTQPRLAARSAGSSGGGSSGSGASATTSACILICDSCAQSFYLSPPLLPPVMSYFHLTTLLPKLLPLLLWLEFTDVSWFILLLNGTSVVHSRVSSVCQYFPTRCAGGYPVLLTLKLPRRRGKCVPLCPHSLPLLPEFQFLRMCEEGSLDVLRLSEHGTYCSRCRVKSAA